MKPLPCLPCPHHAVCCSWGTTLIGQEVEDIRRVHGEDAVVWNGVEHRTRVADGRCVFLTAVGCAIHEEPYYPRICRGFPFRQGDTDGPYEGDVTICTEMT